MQKKTDRRKSLFKGLFVLALLLLIGIHVLTLREKIEEAKMEKAALNDRINATEQENSTLAASLEKADDPEYLQEQARSQLGLVTPGEKQFVFN